MGSQLTKVIGNFQTTLAANISAGGTTGTLSSANDKEGNALPAGKYCMVVNQGQSNEQHMIFDLSGVNMTNIVGVDHSGDVVVGALKDARINNPIKLTDFVNLLRIVDILNGISTLDGTSPMKYDADPTFTDSKQLITKGYADAILSGLVGTATDLAAGTNRMTKNQGAKPRAQSTYVREQDTPDMTLKVESFRGAFIDKIINFAGGNSPAFINPGMGGDITMPTNNPSNGETVTLTINGTACVFTFVTTIGSTPGNVLIGGNVAASRANLAALINAPGVTTANGVAFTGAQLTALGLVNCTDDLSTNIFVRATSSTVTTFTMAETMAGAGNVVAVNTTKNRLDLLVLDNGGSLAIRKGTEAVSPTAPTPTTGDTVLVSVYNIPGETSIKDRTAALSGYITEWYGLAVYRTDLATISQLPVALTAIAGETLAVGDPVSAFFSGAPRFDAKTTNNSSVSSAGGTHSFAFSVANNSNRMMVVFINLGMSSGTVPTPTVTYNGVSMTARNVQTIASSAKLFTFTLAAPATGSNTLAVTIGASAGTVYSSVAVHSYYDASSAIENDVGAVAATVAYGTPAKGVVIASAVGYNVGSSSANNFDNYSDGGINSFSRICSADSGQSYVDTSATVTYTGGGAISAIGIAPASSLSYSIVKTSASNTTNAVNKNKWDTFVGFVSAITGGGVLGTTTTIKENGIVTGLSGLIPLATYYLSNTSGVISTTPGTNSKKIGVALTTTSLLIKHDN